MSIEAIIEERKRDLIDALSFREPKKIPVGISVLSWPFSYAGVRYNDVADDPETVAREYLKFLDVIGIDFICGAEVTRPVKAYNALGNYCYKIAGDGISVVHYQPEVQFMSADEYPELIANPEKFKSDLTKRRCEALQMPKAEAYEKVKIALREIDKWSSANGLISRYILDEKGILSLTNAPIHFRSPLSEIFDNLRGMRDTLTDLRRRPDVLREACNALLEQMKINLTKFDPGNFTSPYPLGRTVYHAECFISPAQFDEFFFRPFTELMLPFMEAGLKIFVRGEGKFLNTIDRYRELPKGAVVFMLDEDDPFEIYKAIGDWQSISAGITTDLLQLGTKEQCTDYVKKSFDTFAPGGGFIFMQNKSLLSGSDAKIENLIAVYEMANELSLK